MPTKQSIAQAKYDAKNCRYYGLKLVHKTDQDIIDKLASVPSMQGYIKQLIRDDIARSQTVSVQDINTVIDNVLPIPEVTELSDENHIYTSDKLESFEQAIEAVKKQK